MTSPKTPSALAEPRDRRRAEAPHSPAGRAWHAIRAAWLARRLKRIDAELLTLTAQMAGHDREGRSEILRHDIADYESLCTERAVLHAQIDRRRAL